LVIFVEQRVDKLIIFW